MPNPHLVCFPCREGGKIRLPAGQCLKANGTCPTKPMHKVHNYHCLLSDQGKEMHILPFQVMSSIEVAHTEAVNF